MKLHVKEARGLFIEEWSNLALSWGVNRSVGRVHAYLLLAKEPVTHDELIETLKLSRGNANSSIRELLDYGVIRRISKPSDRAFYFVAEKDMWKVAQLVAKARKRRELDPIIESLSAFDRLEGPKAEVDQMRGLLDSIKSSAKVAETALTLMDRTGIVSFLKLLS